MNEWWTTMDGDSLTWTVTVLGSDGVASLVGFASGVAVSVLLFVIFGRILDRNHGSPRTLFDHSPDDVNWHPEMISTDPERFVTNEEILIRLLIANGGRMKQSQVVRSTDWSESKVSRFLQHMEAQGDISRVDAGRTKLVYLGQLGGESARDDR